ncbi:MAG: diaminopropionate ammonia-lyase [Phycisphaerales bacterium]|nr:MAG: diaminopropionate ammonia-lyase [Phycisphaerales bacterium]
MSELHLNPRVDSPAAVGWPLDGDPRAFHRRLPGYRPTPLHRLPDLAAQLNVGGVLIKDESDRFGLPAFKVLGASWAVYREIINALGGEEPAWQDIDELREIVADLKPLRLVTATDGNHGRGVARTAAWLGLEAIVFVPAGTVAARIAGIEAEGATVHVIDGSYDETVCRAAEAAADERAWLIQDTSWSGYEEIPRRVIEGYSTLFREIDEELEAASEPPPDLVLVQIGVGSLAAAAVMHYRAKAKAKQPRIVGVEPTDAACALESAKAGSSVTVTGPHESIMAGLNCGTLASLAWPVLSAGMDAFLSIDDDLSRQAMRLMADCGLVTGESGAAGLGGLLYLLSPEAADARQRLRIGPDPRVLIISTEGATDPVSYRRILGFDPASPCR